MASLQEQVKKIAQALKAANEDIKAQAPKCKICGLPTSGFIPVGYTPAQAGICLGNHPQAPGSDCPYCKGTGLDLSGSSGGSCPHCFNGKTQTQEESNNG